MHILHALPGAPGALKLPGDDAMIDRCEDLDDLDLWMLHAEYDAVLLDPLADRGIGRRWAQRYRARGGRAGLVFIVDDLAPDLAIALLALGDDLVRLPIRPDEMLARVGALVRRCRGYESACLVADKLVVDTSICRARYAGRDLRLTKQEFVTLTFLMLRRNQVVTKEAILLRLYQERDEAEIKIVDILIHKIRRKLAEAGAPAPQEIVRTEWGHGYMVPHAAAPSRAAAPPLRGAA